MDARKGEMKTRMVQEREGEKMGEIDFSYDFLQHYDNYCCSDDEKKRMCDKCVVLLKELVEGMKQGKKYKVEEGGGYWRECYDTGMYDGWPWWREVPHVLLKSTIGGWSPEWRPFYDVRDIEEIS